MVKLSLAGLGLMLVVGCALGPAQVRTMAANNAFAMGANQDALRDYILAQKDVAVNSQVLNYNLGNLYTTLGESDAAFRLWDAALSSSDDELLFNTQFNRGIAFYESGKYREALECFRHALEIRPSNLDAKINLELTYQKNIASQNRAAAVTGSAPATVDQGEAARLLDYVRRKESTQWVRNPGKNTDQGMDDR